MSNAAPTGDPAPEEYTELLRRHLATCEVEGRYYEAECTKRRLKEIKLRVQKSKTAELKSRHRTELNFLNQAHQSEIERFEMIWAQRLNEFDNRAAELDAEMRLRHESEAQQAAAALRGNFARPRFSGRLLNMRRVEQTLARQGKYAKAQGVQREADALEHLELQLHQAKAEKSLEAKQATTRQKQALDLAVLRKRIESGRVQLVKGRLSDMRNLERRFLNARRELGTQHKLELQQVRKYIHVLGPHRVQGDPRNVDSIVARYIRQPAPYAAAAHDLAPVAAVPRKQTAPAKLASPFAAPVARRNRRVSERHAVPDAASPLVKSMAPRRARGQLSVGLSRIAANSGRLSAPLFASPKPVALAPMRAREPGTHLAVGTLPEQPDLASVLLRVSPRTAPAGPKAAPLQPLEGGSRASPRQGSTPRAATDDSLAPPSTPSQEGRDGGPAPLAAPRDEPNAPSAFLGDTELGTADPDLDSVAAPSATTADGGARASEATRASAGLNMFGVPEGSLSYTPSGPDERPLFDFDEGTAASEESEQRAVVVTPKSYVSFASGGDEYDGAWELSPSPMFAANTDGTVPHSYESGPSAALGTPSPNESNAPAQ